MSDAQDVEGEGPEQAATPGGAGAGLSVVEFLQRRTGEARRVTLRDEGSAQTASPLIDPSSQEKHAIPQGRGTYQLLGEIARGGMGVILKGHDTDLRRIRGEDAGEGGLSHGGKPRNPGASAWTSSKPFAPDARSSSSTQTTS